MPSLRPTCLACRAFCLSSCVEQAKSEEATRSTGERGRSRPVEIRQHFVAVMVAQRLQKAGCIRCPGADCGRMPVHHRCNGADVERVLAADPVWSLTGPVPARGSGGKSKRSTTRTAAF